MVKWVKHIAFWASMNLVELLHCFKWHFFVVIFNALSLCLFVTALWRFLLPSLPTSQSYTLLLPLCSSTGSLHPDLLCLSSLACDFKVTGLWLLWWKNKCLLLIGEQPSTIGILGENRQHIYRQTLHLNFTLKLKKTLLSVVGGSILHYMVY